MYNCSPGQDTPQSQAHACIGRHKERKPATSMQKMLKHMQRMRRRAACLHRTSVGVAGRCGICVSAADAAAFSPPPAPRKPPLSIDALRLGTRVAPAAGATVAETPLSTDCPLSPLSLLPGIADPPPRDADTLRCRGSIEPEVPSRLPCRSSGDCDAARSRDALRLLLRRRSRCCASSSSDAAGGTRAPHALCKHAKQSPLHETCPPSQHPLGSVHTGTEQCPPTRFESRQQMNW